MRHWLLRAIPLLAVVPGIWTPLTFATPTLRNNRIDPATRVVSQHQQSGPQALSLPSIYRHSSPLVIPRAIAKRNGIFFQELTSDFLLHYYTFTVSFAERSPVSQYISSGKERSHFTHFFPVQSTKATKLILAGSYTILAYRILARELLVPAWTPAPRRPRPLLHGKGHKFQLGPAEAGTVQRQWWHRWHTKRIYHCVGECNGELY